MLGGAAGRSCALSLSACSPLPAVLPVGCKAPATHCLQVFSQLEESNLFLIQNGQEAEEQLEELRGRLRDTR